MIIEGMATNGAEPTYCMGDDIPLPVLSSRPHHLGDYFKQRFAQVCHAPVDLPALLSGCTTIQKAKLIISLNDAAWVVISG